MDEFCNEAKINNSIKSELRKALVYISIKSIFSQEEKNEFLSEIPSEIKF